MIDQCCMSFTESKEELSRAASQATLSHVLCGICNKLNESSNCDLERISRTINSMSSKLDNSSIISTPILSYSLVLTSKIAAIMNHLSDNI
ncbi:hypothetical protein MXB_4430, partial [Myxobolus squamalis]